MRWLSEFHTSSVDGIRWSSQFDSEDQKALAIHPSSNIPNLSVAFDQQLLHYLNDKLRLDLWCNTDACERIVRSVGYVQIPRLAITFDSLSSVSLKERTQGFGFSQRHYNITDDQTITYELFVLIDRDFVGRHGTRLKSGAFMETLETANREVLTALVGMLLEARYLESPQLKEIKEELKAHDKKYAPELLDESHQSFNETITDEDRKHLWQAAAQILKEDPLFWMHEANG